MQILNDKHKKLFTWPDSSWTELLTYGKCGVQKHMYFKTSLETRNRHRKIHQKAPKFQLVK